MQADKGKTLVIINSEEYSKNIHTFLMNNKLLAEGTMADLWKGFWTRETGTGQQVAQLHDRYMMMMMTITSVHYPETPLTDTRNLYIKWCKNAV